MILRSVISFFQRLYSSAWYLANSAGEFSTISEDLTETDVAIREGKWGDYIEKQIQKLPGPGSTVAKNLLIGNVIKSQFLTIRDWPFGAATSITLTLVMGLMLLIYWRAARLLNKKVELE